MNRIQYNVILWSILHVKLYLKALYHLQSQQKEAENKSLVRKDAFSADERDGKSVSEGWGCGGDGSCTKSGDMVS